MKSAQRSDQAALAGQRALQMLAQDFGRLQNLATFEQVKNLQMLLALSGQASAIKRATVIKQPTHAVALFYRIDKEGIPGKANQHLVEFGVQLEQTAARQMRDITREQGLLLGTQ